MGNLPSSPPFFNLGVCELLRCSSVSFGKKCHFKRVGSAEVELVEEKHLRLE